MTSPSSNPGPIPAQSGLASNQILPALLVCPACHGPLHAQAGQSALQCAGCRRDFPIVDGIPLLIAE